MTTRISLTAQAHNLIQDTLMPGDCAVDATVGNGHDTEFLLSQVAEQGIVFGFDIQQQAIDFSQIRLEKNYHPEQFQLINASHSDMELYIPQHLHGKIKVIMFNLGYLPNSDKSIITQVNSTLSAVKASSLLIAKEGIISIMAYPGHPGGTEETEQVHLFCQKLASQNFTLQPIISSEKQSAPKLFILRKHSD